MKNHTDAYDRLRRQADEMFGFVVAVCYAMPLLKKEIKTIQRAKIAGFLHRPDYFKHDKSLPDEIQKKGLATYKSKLSAYMLLSSFSYFEDYVTSAISEIINLHGGEAKFMELAKRRVEKFMSTQTAEIKKHKMKLQEPIKRSKAEKYKKHSAELSKLGYRFPSELLSCYGLQLIIEKTKHLKANEIPEILRKGLNMKLDESATRTFHAIRDMRNRLAHGEKVNLSLKRVMDMNSNLRELAKNIDQHLIENFYVIEEYS
jgi:hypothetical protein